MRGQVKRWKRCADGERSNVLGTRPGQGPLRTLGSVTYQKCFGRRDWTRTNDPHHVKVML